MDSRLGFRSPLLLDNEGATSRLKDLERRDMEAPGRDALRRALADAEIEIAAVERVISTG